MTILAPFPNINLVPSTRPISLFAAKLGLALAKLIVCLLYLAYENIASAWGYLRRVRTNVPQVMTIAPFLGACGNESPQRTLRAS